MNIDSPTIRRLRDMLLARAKLPGTVGDDSHGALDETSPEVAALIERVSPICEALYLMMMADGQLHANERETIRGVISALTGGLSSQTVDSMLARYAVAVAKEGQPERLLRVTAMLSADREDAETALALAAAVAVADGSVATAEESLLLELSESLGISCKRAAVILDTID